MKNNFQKVFLTIGEICYFIRDVSRCLFTKPFYFHRFIEQCLVIGAGSLSLSIAIGLVTGLVMTLQFGYGLAKFGGILYVPAIVSLSIVRELAPIFTSLLVAGRVGSSISAEMSAMNVTQQIDALRALGTSPIRILVIPRLIACVLTLPLLATLAAFMGFIGGQLIALTEFDLPAGFYLNKVLQTIKINDITGSLIKCSIFGAIIVILACYRGFKTKDGTKGVGNASTWVVVTSSISILVSDFFLTKLLILIFH